MEPVGLAIGVAGLAGLFNSCLDVIDRASSYKHYGVETRAIIAQLDADKLLLEQWGQRVGIREGKLEETHHRYLDSLNIKFVVEKILSSIKELFTKKDIALLDSNYIPGADPKLSKEGNYSVRMNIQNPRFRETTMSNKLKWALKDKTKFIAQVQQFGTLVQKLHDLVPADPSKTMANENTYGVLERDSNYRSDWLSEFKLILTQNLKHIEDVLISKAETKLEIDKWLDGIYTNDLYDNFRQKGLDGTCDWIKNRPAFLDWISADFPSKTAKTLWINGPAGYGKTMICTKLIEYLSETFNSPLGYYFFSSDSQSQGDPFVIIRSWISQIVASDQNALEITHERWQAKDGYIASRTDIMVLFRKIVQSIPNCTFVVDGLDECIWQKKNWKTEDNSRVEFLEFLKHAVAQTTTRIMIVSRDEVDIRRGILGIPDNDPSHNFYEYKISPEDVKSDVMLFSQSVVDKKLPNKPKTLRDDLSGKISERSNGMFLWIKMLEDNLRSGKSTRQLESVIDHTPTGLEDLYNRNWNKISSLPEDDRTRAFSILRWVAFAVRPLSISEITEAILVKDDDSYNDLLVDELPDAIDEDYINTEIVGLCESLVEIQRAGSDESLGARTVQLTHFSVKQYIIYNMLPPGVTKIHGSLCSHEVFHSNELSKACLRYLGFRNTWQKPNSADSKLNNQAFRDYAASSWHQNITSTCSNYREVVDLVNKLFNPANENWHCWRRWFDTRDLMSKRSDKPESDILADPLYYASRLGIYDTVLNIIQKSNQDINHVDKLQRTALQSASNNGHLEVVKLLLENGADLSAADNDGETPLNAASDSGHLEVVKLLLEKGTDLSVSDINEWTPLNSASDSGHLEVVKLLLENGADLSVSDVNGWTPLNTASDNGHLEVVKLLLDNSANLSVANKNGWTPLNSASATGYLEVVKLLLENGADLSVANKNGWTPLNSASDSGHLEVVKLLLENSADLSVANKNGWTPLNSASASGHLEVVKLLLENGADLSVSDVNGWTPLNTASDNGHLEVVKLLLDNSANLSVANKNGWTPLNSASASGHLEVVKLLLEKGAAIYIADNNGWTSLNLASATGHLEVVNLLLEKGAELSAAYNDGRTPLNTASANGHLEVVKLLLEKGTAVSIADKNGWTPLNLASATGHLEVVKFLLEKDADLSAADNDGSTSLILASNNGNLEIVNLLLENGADLSVANKNGWTPLNSASATGYLEVVKLLLENGADLSVANKNGWTPLNSASDNGHLEVVKLLLEKGADLSVAKKNGWTPLHTASSKGNVDIVKCLLESCQINPMSKDNNGRTAFFCAAMRGHDDLARLYLSRYPLELYTTDCFNATPLFVAVRNGHDKVAELLLATDETCIHSTDCFGRTLIWSAQRSGNNQLIQLIHHCTTRAGLQVDDLDTSEKSEPVKCDPSLSWCDVCTLCIQDESDYYECGICDGGDFCICLECFEFGVKCQNDSHTWQLHKSEGNVVH
ncbi:Ankyrin repeat domain-containing 52 protein [Rutstroemia sp. NJR-2017a WRK4]|nr:Ankyrin repeat domain-containing 52 protein [Rutstroemia sp. NJR-2017a WRK4]